VEKTGASQISGGVGPAALAALYKRRTGTVRSSERRGLSMRSPIDDLA
jgi:hypothetical protein